MLRAPEGPTLLLRGLSRPGGLVGPLPGTGARMVGMHGMDFEIGDFWHGIWDGEF